MNTCSVLAYYISRALSTWPYHIFNLNSTKSLFIWDNIFGFSPFLLNCTKPVQCWISNSRSNFNVGFVDGICANKSVAIPFNTKFQIKKMRLPWIQSMCRAQLIACHTVQYITSHMAKHHVENISNGNTWQHTEIPMSLILKNTRQNARVNESNLNISLAYDNFENYFDSFDLWSIGAVFAIGKASLLKTHTVWASGCSVSTGDTMHF